MDFTRPARSQPERTGQEDRRLKFYGLRDNLQLTVRVKPIVGGVIRMSSEASSTGHSVTHTPVFFSTGESGPSLQPALAAPVHRFPDPLSSSNSNALTRGDRLSRLAYGFGRSPRQHQFQLPLDAISV